ncbi:toll/interleukin-1 receptor domain-containing protein [Kineosporia babensis]|uniref:Toll/interleukin-1 receptor domain-containing protein n=1 Tax=Kineosporia babensis TaxID=499548 RepID=A0A9X1NP24_9ACTN|nr:toll/interleukin-1 receptor domain-containing protein [Kineosporia babensis]MCD5316608.1 toll/interleukin-1 receptor domain-containing protein [Kineosporia babensis]
MASAGRVDFFISYANADRDPDWAQWIADTLESASYTSRLQAWDIGPSGNFVVDMHDFTLTSDRLIMVFSPDYLDPKREMVLAEWTAKFRDDPAGRKGLLLPVRVRACNPTGLLGPRVYIDLVNLDKAAAKQVLLEGVDPNRRKPTTVPFPG